LQLASEPIPRHTRESAVHHKYLKL
jgi:hypothetical protein